MGKVKKKSKKPYKFGAQLLSHWDQLLDRVSIKNDSMDKIWCSISEVMTEVYSIPGITFNDELYYFATDYFSKRKKREMGHQLKILIGSINGFKKCIREVKSTKSRLVLL
jgi:hypothetical protein